MGASIAKLTENRNGSQINLLEKDLTIFLTNNRNNNIYILHYCVPNGDVDENDQQTKRIFLVRKNENVIIDMFSNITNHIYIYDKIVDCETIIQKIKNAQCLKNRTSINIY